jgi:aldehyde:ferredoxin oxidoreductase
MKGYTGKILSVDLTQRTWAEENIPDEVYERHLSGIGLAAHILYARIPPEADPLGAENILGFVSGILTGTGALFSGRWLVAGKSPLTGGWGDANCGGNLGPAIKQCGYDGIFIRGMADEPVYLYADGTTVEIRDAGHVWGKDATETEAVLVEESGNPSRARVACIGPAGEKLSLISGICNDRGRIAGRSGLGAVMGSKKLKALVLAGSKPVQFADKDELKRLSKACSQYVPKEDIRFPAWIIVLVGRFLSAGKRASRLDGTMSFPVFRKWGTTSGNQVSIFSGDTPIKNWNGSRVDYSSKNVNPDRFAKWQLKKYHCYACPLSCGAISKGPADYPETHRPEYETIASFGALLLNHDLESIFYINELLNRAGMDTISAGATIAFAIECFENGLLTEVDTGGLKLSWGNTQAIVKLVEMMVARQGIGDVLADGVRVAATKIGNSAGQYAIHAGGQELPMHDPKYDTGFGVHYLADPTPGRHTIGSGTTYETLRLWQKVSWAPEAPKSYLVSDRYGVDVTKGIHSAGCSLAKMVIDGAGLCNFGLMLGVDRFPMFEYLNAATGWHKSPDEYMEIGRRVQTLRQLFNLRQGIEPAALTLPGKTVGDPPLQQGALKGRKLDVYAWRKYYWQALGWDPETGHPLAETLDRLGLITMAEGSAAG